MGRAMEMNTQRAPLDVAPPPDLQCRVCELETENTRLRLLVSELLVANQQLREKAKAGSGSTAA